MEKGRGGFFAVFGGLVEESVLPLLFKLLRLHFIKLYRLTHQLERSSHFGIKGLVQMRNYFRHNKRILVVAATLA